MLALCQQYGLSVPNPFSLLLPKQTFILLISPLTTKNFTERELTRRFCRTLLSSGRTVAALRLFCDGGDHQMIYQVVGGILEQLPPQLENAPLSLLRGNLLLFLPFIRYVSLFTVIRCLRFDHICWTFAPTHSSFGFPRFLCNGCHGPRGSLSSFSLSR